MLLRDLLRYMALVLALVSVRVSEAEREPVPEHVPFAGGVAESEELPVVLAKIGIASTVAHVAVLVKCQQQQSSLVQPR